MMVHFGTGAGVAFPDFDKILDFTSAGSEASVSVDVSNDLEYKVLCYNKITNQVINFQFNTDTGDNYGYQYLLNNAGTISAGRNASNYFMRTQYKGWSEVTAIAPEGFIKTSFNYGGRWSSGTTVEYFILWGHSWNNTANISSIQATPATGNFASGTRIIVYRRRVN